MTIKHHTDSISMQTETRYIERQNLPKLIEAMTETEYKAFKEKHDIYTEQHLENEHYEQETFNINKDEN